MSNIKQILINARAVIDTPEKWYKGDWSNDTGTCHCTMGALVKGLEMNVCDVKGRGYHEVKELVHDHPATVLLKDVIGIKELSGPENEYGSIATWNDKEHRTHAEVMAAFDEAIARA